MKVTRSNSNLKNEEIYVISFREIINFFMKWKYLLLLGILLGASSGILLFKYIPKLYKNEFFLSADATNQEVVHDPTVINNELVFILSQKVYVKLFADVFIEKIRTQPSYIVDQDYDQKVEKILRELAMLHSEIPKEGNPSEDGLNLLNAAKSSLMYYLIQESATLLNDNHNTLTAKKFHIHMEVENGVWRIIYTTKVKKVSLILSYGVQEALNSVIKKYNEDTLQAKEEIRTKNLMLSRENYTTFNREWMEYFSPSEREIFEFKKKYFETLHRIKSFLPQSEHKYYESVKTEIIVQSEQDISRNFSTIEDGLLRMMKYFVGLEQSGRLKSSERKTIEEELIALQSSLKNLQEQSLATRKVGESLEKAFASQVKSEFKPIDPKLFSLPGAYPYEDVLSSNSSQSGFYESRIGIGFLQTVLLGLILGFALSLLSALGLHVFLSSKKS